MYNDVYVQVALKRQQAAEDKMILEMRCDGNDRLTPGPIWPGIGLVPPSEAPPCG